MGFIQDFKEFAFKGNLIDMAVGIVMGGAVAAIVQSFLKNIITPVIAMVAKVPDMSQLKWVVGESTPKLNEAGEKILNSSGEVVMEPGAAINYGSFLQNTMDFVILALVIFLALKIAARWMKKAEEAKPPAPEVQLLTEIRDALASK
ncbi:MAG: large conductance mechanosensitive channel protein MscL [Planctomycetota bacterium]